MPFNVYCEGSLTLNQPLSPRHRAHLELLGKVWRHDYYPERVFKVADLPESEPFPDPTNNDKIFLDMLPWQVLEDGHTLQPRYQYTLSERLRWLKYLIEDFL